MTLAAGKKTERQKIVADLCRKFRTSSTMQIAAIAYEKHPRLFTTKHAARHAVMLCRGEGVGVRAKRQIGDKPEREGTKRIIAPLPESHGQERLPFVVEGCKSVAVLSDLHIPYHDVRLIKAALEALDKWKPDTILLNGDILDFEAISHWDSSPDRPDTKMELALGREFFTHMRQRYRKARIIYKLGNHDERFEKYLRTKSPQLYNIPEVQMSWQVAMGLNDLGVEVVGDQKAVMLGKLYVYHGHEGKVSGIHAAKNLLTKVGVNALAGHVHRITEASDKSVDGRHIFAWTMGCLCNQSPDYAPINKWTAGFVTCDVMSDGEFHLTNHKIINGKVY